MPAGNPGKVIAVEEHILTSGFHLSMREWANFERMMQSLDMRFEDMDRAGVDMHVLSLSAPGVHLEPDAGVAADKAARSNDEVAAVVAKHPDRLAAFAAIALQDPEAGANELERAVRQLGFKGAMINHHTNGAYLDDQKVLPFLERAVDLDVPVYIHPSRPLEEPAVTRGYPGLGAAMWGWSHETGAHALRLVLAGVFDRLPSLTIILGHMAEMLPFCLWRIDSRYSVWPGRPRLEKLPSDYIRENFYATTSGSFDSVPLLGAIGAIGADRIMFAVDYPYEPSDEAVAFLKNAPIAEIDRAKIAHGNATRVLKL